MRQYDVIVVEDIGLRAMGGALKLGKNLHDNGFGMFRDMLSYKLEKKGSVLVKVDRMYASTQTCSSCGHRLQGEDRLTLKDRKWTCPACGTVNDRDMNAAVNIREEGKRIFTQYFRTKMEEERESAARAARKKEALKKPRNKKEPAA